MTESKVAVITGAGSGIGRGLAQFAASKKMQLVLCDVNTSGLDETLAMLPLVPVIIYLTMREYWGRPLLKMSLVKCTIG